VVAIRKLETLCKMADHLHGTVSLDLSLNIKTLKGCYLASEEGKLLGALIIFAPSTAEAEISAFTDPALRKQGLFKKLLTEAVKELKKHNVKDLLFVCEADSESGKAVIAKVAASYCFTEYNMRYTGDSQIRVNSDVLRSSLVAATIEDLDDLIGLRHKIFGDNREEARLIMQKSLGSDSRQQYLLRYEDRAIGLCAAGFEEAGVSIYGLGILPEFQGQGFGRELLEFAVKDLIAKGCRNLTIEVNSTNNRALELYKGSGFKITLAYDYYRLPLQEYIDSLSR
jgi:ribosomal protein S18 acetylase RimI-like enzyme